MRLVYYKDGFGNFGDDLNPLIWYSLFPTLFDNSSDNGVILGIGTLINDRAPQNVKVHVLGSGVGYHGRARVNDDWNFEFVRGPRSAQALSLAPDKAICDPSVLVSRIFRPLPRKLHSKNITFMPHHASSRFANWREVCLALGIENLDPSDDVCETIHRIRNSRYLITEAMHGAIVADAVRVPWVPVVAYSHILPFKWQDWCESVGLQYNPVLIPELWDMDQFYDSSVVFKSKIKRTLIRLGVSAAGWTPPLVAGNKQAAMPEVFSAFERLLADPPLMLSDDQLLSQRLEQLDQAICSFGRRMGLM